MPARRNTILLSLAVIAATSAATFAQTKRPLSFVDIINMPLLQDPQLTPDGRHVAYVMFTADWRANRPIGHIHRANSDGSNSVQLTFGERGESTPRWSPDSRTLAFLARRDGDTSNQIYLLTNDGGEARRLTSHQTAPLTIQWAPDGAAIFFTAADAPTAEERERTRLQDDVYAFEENFKHRHLWVADLAGKTRKLTDGSFSVMGFDVSVDGSRIVMSRAPSPLLEHSAESEVWVMDSSGSNARQLTNNAVQENNASLSPDNSTVVFRAGANAKFEPYYNDKIFVVPAAGGEPRALLTTASHEVMDVEWAEDSKNVYFLANMGLHTELMKLDVATAGADATLLTFDEHAIAGWTYVASAKTHVFMRNTPSRASEVYTLRADGQEEPRRITDVFDYVDRQFVLARQHRIAWKGQDGQEIEGLLYYPANHVAGKRYPLIVISHGGPEESDKYGFSSDAQVYAGKGYVVLRPNYRGSTGYGDAFLRGMVGGYFGQSHLDVMAGVDAVIAMGLADPDRLVTMGASAGGHMTNKLITFTDRFKAASSFAGAANWVSMYAQSDTRQRRDLWFGGTPYEAAYQNYWDQSPLKDVARAKTPTLFIVGEQDARVPLAQSVEMYRGLRRHDVPTKLYVGPREGHGFGELRHRLFKFQVEMEWFERHVNNREYVWEPAPGETGREAPRVTTPQP